MRTLLVLFAVAFVSLTARAGEDAGTKDLERLQGTWTFESYEENGKALPAAALKEKRIFFGANQFIIKRRDELLQIGSLKLNPIDGHRDFDATVIAGPQKGKTMLGIYSLKGDTLKVCINPDGSDRPKEFKTTADSGLFLAVYKRVIRTGDQLAIAGKYRSESVQVNGDRETADVEITRRGDCYLLKWSKGILDAHIVGIGIRKGGVLSVCWASKGQIGVCVYELDKERRLVGDWTILGGVGAVQRETLTRRKKADK
jgi:uncharacterized protein (TIGR03067 family)